MAAKNSSKVIREERLQIHTRRARTVGADHPLAPPNYLGVAFSGGGIRSGTFNLGIIQGLTEFGLLPYVDYLSTVSGGGYIGSWLHTLILRRGHGMPEKVAGLLNRPDQNPHDKDSQKDPIVFLRQYSSYLAPSIGLFSADFWVIFVIWIRNMLLNQAILVPFLAALSLVAVHLGFLGNYIEQLAVSWPHYAAVFLVAGCLFGTVWIAGKGVSRLVGAPACDDPHRPRAGKYDRIGSAVTCTALLLGASVLLAFATPALIAGPVRWPFIGIAFAALLALFGVLQKKGGFIECYLSQHRGRSRVGGWTLLLAVDFAAAALTTALLTGAMLWIASWQSIADQCGQPYGGWHTTAWGPPLILLVLLAGAGFHIGLMGIDFTDFGREWLSRLGAFCSIAAFAWAAMFALMVFGPFWTADLLVKHGAWAGTAITGWLGTSISGVLAGKSSATSGNPNAKGSSPLEWIVKIAPTAFYIGFLVLVSWGLQELLHARSAANCPSCQVASTATSPGTAVQSIPLQPNISVQVIYGGGEASRSPNHREHFRAAYWCALNGLTQWEAALGLLGISLIVTLVMQLRININEFSMHHFYKNRLVRCYLGATQGPDRRASRLTGFDPCDDLPLARFQPDPALELPYYGPYPILNTTVTFNRGSDMAKQERKASSFVFTPLFTGYDVPHSQEDEDWIGEGKIERHGYRSTKEFGYPGKGFDIGTCMAISGAAANPNAGFHTSPPMAFLLTIFNVRLGWWVGNTRFENASATPGPSFALIQLLSELFAQTDPRSKYVNLSDGGNFENLGIYELIRRRCRFIIAGDGEQDGDYTFESLGGVVRKCRTDFGVQIDIDPRLIIPKDELSRRHCVVGRITYPEDPQNPGFLLYLKASLTGDEPEDIAQYRASHADFPQQPTADQFFTESQFESYRRLGLHVVRSVFQNTDVKSVLECPRFAPYEAIANLFQRLDQQWYPPTKIADGVSTNNAGTYSELMKRLSGDTDLQYLIGEQIISPAGNATLEAVLMPPVPAGQSPEARAALERKAFYYCLELIQLIENVWADLHFSEVTNRNNPNYAGWMTVFRYWARQPIFRTTWERSAYTFNPLFRQFFDSVASEPPPVKATTSPCGRFPKDSQT